MSGHKSPFGIFEQDVVDWLTGQNREKARGAWETVLDLAQLAYDNREAVILAQCPLGHFNYGHDDEEPQKCTCGICQNQGCPEKLEREYLRAYLPVEVRSNGTFEATDCCATRGTIADFILLQNGAPYRQIFSNFSGMPEHLRELEVFAGYQVPADPAQYRLFEI